MANWSVMPNTNVNIEPSTGKITFPKNETGNKIDYTITATENGCSVSTTYTIPACIQEPEKFWVAWNVDGVNLGLLCNYNLQFNLYFDDPNNTDLTFSISAIVGGVSSDLTLGCSFDGYTIVGNCSQISGKPSLTLTDKEKEAIIGYSIKSQSREIDEYLSTGEGFNNCVCRPDYYISSIGISSSDYNGYKVIQLTVSDSSNFNGTC